MVRKLLRMGVVRARVSGGQAGGIGSTGRLKLRWDGKVEKRAAEDVEEADH